MAVFGCFSCQAESFGVFPIVAHGGPKKNWEVDKKSCWMADHEKS